MEVRHVAGARARGPSGGPCARGRGPSIKRIRERRSTQAMALKS